MSQCQTVIYQSNLVIFDEVKLALNSLCREESSGAFVIASESGDGAGFLLENGKITDAAYQLLRGRAALFSIKRIKRARFFFEREISDLPSLNEDKADLPDTASILGFIGMDEKEKAIAAPVETPVPAPVSANKGKVVVVDDSRMVRAVVRKILIKDNFDVIECADGEQAIATVEKERPDLVLLDIVMPGLDGNEVLRRIRATEFGKQLPVLILTSSDTLVAENSDASGRLSKPFKPYDLLLKLKAYFPVNESDAP